MKPEISVIMPAHNSKKFLRESVESILNQTFKDFELIIINDCSTDSSLRIIKSYKDKRIKLINNKKNLGTVKSRNVGLKAAKGKYIAILDSDDISYPKRLEIQFNYLENNPHIFLVGSSAIYMDEKGKEIRRFRKYDDYKMLAWRLPKSCSIVHSSVMFRNTKEIFYNEFYKSAHDYNLYLDLLSMKKNITNLPQFLVSHRVHGGASHEGSERQKIFCHLTQKEHKYLNDKVRLLDKLEYSLELGAFYLITFMEKRGR